MLLRVKRCSIFTRRLATLRKIKATKNFTTPKTFFSTNTTNIMTDFLSFEELERQEREGILGYREPNETIKNIAETPSQPVLRVSPNRKWGLFLNEPKFVRIADCTLFIEK